ncbi:MAG: NupC/NupG family nucleoside CNT transporter [Bacteroidia bacterium]
MLLKKIKLKWLVMLVFTVFTVVLSLSQGVPFDKVSSLNYLQKSTAISPSIIENTGHLNEHVGMNWQLNFTSVLRGGLGLIFLLGLCYLLSTNRKAIRWKLVFLGVAMQILFAILVFKVPFVKLIFEWMAGFFVVVLEFTKEGSNFLFEGLLDVKTVGYLFAFQVLPTIIFFSALTSLLYYLGILQKVVYGIAWLMSKTMKLSGAESLSTAANIFLGQTEAPLMVKPYIAGMTRSEMLCIMVGGMATIAGGVLAAYVGFLGGSDPEQQKIFATHLLTASVLAAPATIVAAKMLLPETEPVNENLDLPKEKIGSNLLEAITNGTTEGVKLAVNVGAMLLVFTALIAMLNFVLKDGIGEWTGLNEIIRHASLGKTNGLSLQLILGYLFSPIAFMIGIQVDDILLSGQLLGEKTVLNEFYAYSSLSKLKDAGAFAHAQTVIILTYALCGFANIASIGVQIGGISLMAPNQKATLSQLGVKALIGGTIACFMTACIAGMFF